MKLSTVACGLVSMAATVTAQSESPKAFEVRAIHSASEIHLAQVEAADRAFWIGGEPSTYCPSQQVGDNCPPGNTTVFNGPNALNANVPGGQQIYAEPSGALGFTQAHSISMPPGSTTEGFEYEPGQEHGHFKFTNWGAHDFLACTVPGKPHRQVFANIKNVKVPTGDLKDCIDFVAIAVDYKGPTPAAWQYQ